MNATITDSRLEEMMQDEAACEALHYEDEPQWACTVDVSYRYRAECTSADKLVCAASGARVAYGVTVGAVCDTCSHPVADCWSVVPV